MIYFNILIIITLLNTTIKSKEHSSVETFNVPENNIKKSIVLGATSGMGSQISKILTKKGYIIDRAGKRVKLL